MTRVATASAAVSRLAQACGTIKPRTRSRLLATFLAINFVIVMLSAADAQRLGWLGSAAWIRQLDFDAEGTLANAYAAGVWAAVALLALAQLLCAIPPRKQKRLWVIGWLSAALLATLIALEEYASLKDWIAIYAAPVDVSMLTPEGWPTSAHWLIIAVPLFGAPLAAAGWVLVSSQRGHPARALLTSMAAVLAIATIPKDSHVLTVAPRAWRSLLEEGSEVMAAATLAVILFETLSARPGAIFVTSRSRRRKSIWRAAPVAVTAVLLVAGAFALLTWHEFEGRGWRQGSPRYYTGPITLVEQRFRSDHNNLRRIDVWSYVDRGNAEEPAEIFARLTPVDGPDRPIRESRAEVRNARFSDATVTFEFHPIPDSGGTFYELAVGVLSGPTPFVFLGLTGGDAIAEGAAVVSGAPTPFLDDLAMRTTWNGRFIEGLLPNVRIYWLSFVEVIFHIFMWAFLVVAVWNGLSCPRPRFWRSFVWPSVFASALITAGIVSIALTVLVWRSPSHFA